MNISYLAMSDVPSKNANSLQIVQMCNAFAEIGNNVKLVIPAFNNLPNSSLNSYYGIKNNIEIIRIGRKRNQLSKLDNIILPLKLSIYSLLNKKNFFITRNLLVSFFLIIFRINHVLELHDDLEISANGTGFVNISSDGTFSSQASSDFASNFGDISTEYKSNNFLYVCFIIICCFYKSL